MPQLAIAGAKFATRGEAFLRRPDIIVVTAVPVPPMGSPTVATAVPEDSTTEEGSTRAPSARRCSEVLMVGTSLDVRGGISTVVRGYRDGGLFGRFPLQYVATHRDGSAFVKLGAAVRGYARLARLLLTADAPLVHIHLASRASFWRKSIACALTLARGRPYLLHVHGAEFSKFYDQECGVLSKGIIRFVLRRAALVLALSDQWRTELLRIAPGATVRTLPNAVAVPAAGVDTQRSAPSRILFAGRIGERKGTFELLEAFARIANRVPDAVLVCAGDGAREELLARAKRLGIDTRVECPGWLSAEGMSRELSRATVFTLPSHAEGVPMALLEAMSRGLPVLTTPVGGIPEVVQSDRNGLLVPPGNIDAIEQALVRLLSSPDERAALGTAARATIAEKFALSAIIEQLAALYVQFGLKDAATSRTRA
jgi:glycosyltransferase involved in cell wall biosynthesis